MLKTAQYRKAMWLDRRGYTLEMILGDVFNQCPLPRDTKFPYKTDTQVHIASRNIGANGDGLGCYFTLYTEGQRAAAIDNGGANLTRVPAPRGTEFLKTGVHLVVQGDHVAYISNSHTNDGQITGLLHCLFNHCDFDNERTQFQLMPRANRREVERLLRMGVKSIDLGIGAYLATIEEMNAGQQERPWVKPFADLATAIGDVFGDDRPMAEVEAASELEARISLSFDGRSANRLAPEIMSSIASDIVQDAGEFRIVTMQDVVITQDKLVIKATITVDGDDVAVSPVSSFPELRRAMAEWRDAGVFED